MRISFENQTNLSRNIKKKILRQHFFLVLPKMGNGGGEGRGGSLNTDVFDY